MPTVPVAQNRVGIAEVSGAKLQAPDYSGTGLQAVGAGMQQLGQTGARVAEEQQRIQDIYDDAAVKQSYNQYDEATRPLLRTGEGAFYSQQGSGAVEALKPTGEALTRIRDDIRKGLKTDRQRQAFDSFMSKRVGQDLEGIHTYADGQNKVWQSQQTKGLIKNSADNALDHVGTPMFAEYVATGLKAIDGQADAEGWAPEFKKSAEAEYVSGIHKQAIDRQTVSDPVAAAAYYRDHGNEMVVGDRLDIEKSLYAPMMEREAAAVVDGYPGAATGAEPVAVAAPAGGGSSAARMVAITMHSESGSRDYANGRLVTSSKGAQGRMQTMPGTQRDPGFGIRPAQDDSVEEKARVGRDYLAAMMKRYGNDPAKAWAAYNAGPGAVDNAVKKGGNWLASMPAETQGYVRKNIAMLGGSSTPTYSPRRDDLNGIYQYIERQNLPYELKKAALAEADRRVSRNDRLLNRAQDDAKDAAYEVISGMGDGFTSLNQLPPDVVRGLSPEAKVSIQAQAAQNAKPKEVPANGDAIVNLHVLANGDPDAFLKTDLRTLKPYMSRGEFDQISTLQAAMAKKANSPEQVSHSRIWQQINFYGRDIGVNVDAKKKGESDKQFAARRQDGMQLFTVMQNYLRNLTEGKRQPTDDDIKKAFDNAVMPRVGATGVAAPRYRDTALPSNSVAIPQSVHDRIRANLKALGEPFDDRSVALFYLKNKR